MTPKLKSIYFLPVVLIIILALFILFSGQKVEITNLRVEYTKNPIGIDIVMPRFSWQMNVRGSKRDYSQTAYQLVVTGPEGKVVWDSEKMYDDRSLNINYCGSELKPSTRYDWNVTVWDQDGKATRGNSWFETGILNPDPDLSGWHDADWIGGTDNDLVLYSPYLSVFQFSYKLALDQASGSTRAGFIFGANDSRLMDKNKNIFWMESKKDESYIMLELDISSVDGSMNGLAKFNIYRVGYHPDDSPDKPFKSYTIPRTIIHNNNKYKTHEIFTEAVFGLFTIYINGRDADNLVTRSLDPRTRLPNENLNPAGRGNNSISYPMLAEIGFSAEPGQKASFSGLEIRNYRSPSNILFSEDLSIPASYTGAFAEFTGSDETGIEISGNSYQIDGGKKGSLIIANPSRNSMPMLRTVFTTDNKKIDRARLYITSRGIYEVFINGQRIGDDYFNPGLTQYNLTHMYQTYDVTKNIKPGENAVGALLGEGWWSGNITYSGENWNYFGDRQSLLAKLVLTYSDGTSKIVSTNPESWYYYNDGPMVYSSFFQGEVYDGSKEKSVEGWNEPGYDYSEWKKAVRIPLEGTTCVDETFGQRMGFSPITSYDDMMLIGQIGDNAGIVKELTAISVEEARPGVFVYDMGQNMVGIPEIILNNEKAGSIITLRFAEVLYPDLSQYGENVGMIMLENIRAALAQGMYITRGGREVIRPTFTFHGYRYLEITGIANPLPLDAVKGLVISSVKEITSSYETSNQRVNKLWENIKWSTLGNFLSIPTDCPQRNERMGWGGDILVFARTSTFLTDASQFLNRHLLSMRNTQREDGRFTDVSPMGGGFGGILWGSAGITVTWDSYQQYGDEALLKDHYDAMKKYISFLNRRIDPKANVMNEGHLGDWLSPEGNKNDNTLTWESYFIYNLEVMTRIAEILGKTEDAVMFRKRYDERKAFFNQTYVDPETGKTVKSGFITQRRPAVGDSDEISSMAAGSILDTQISYAVPLALGTFNSENEVHAAKHLANAVMRKNRDDGGKILPEYSLMTGFIGTASISKALSDHGHIDIAYRLLQQTSYPSWLYPVDQGATTIWERLNSYTVEDGFGGNNAMNSFNHYAFGAVGAWMYNYSLGIERDENEPGFKHFILQPNHDPDGKMTFAKGHYDSMYGRIESGWQLDGNNLLYSATVPPNTSATLYLPAISAEEVTEGGKSANNVKGVTFLKFENGKAFYKLRSGTFSFESKIR